MPTTNERLDTILADYFEQIDSGHAVSTSALIESYPDLAGELREFFDAATFVENLAGPTQSEQTQMLGVHDTARNSLVGETIVSSIQKSPTRLALKKGKAPQHFGRYEIVRLLGQGAMGAVYLAYDPSLRRQIALKIPKFNADESPDMSERFAREARAAANLRHANICPVYDVGRVDGVNYISMAYIEGRTLAEELRAGRTFAPREIATIVRKLSLAMAKAHAAGIVHRDLKPGNIMLDPDGEPILMDFGLAYHEETDELRLTKSGMIVGSPAYMSPEQIDGDPTKIGPASDIYSLGVVLYEMITGKLPFQGTMMSVIGQIANKEPTPVGQWRPELADSPLERLCRKLLAKRPEERPQSMQDVAAALDYVLSGLGHEGVRGRGGEGEKSQASLAIKSPPLPLSPSPAPEAKLETRIPSPESRPVTYPATLAHERTERAKMFLATTLILAALLGLFGALAGIVYVATNQGTLEITSLVDDVQVEVSNQDGTVKIIDLVSGTEVHRLRTGDYTIRVKGDKNGVVLDTLGFEIKRGGKVIVQATQKAGATAVPTTTATVPTIERPADPQVTPEWRLLGPKPVTRMISHSGSVRAVAFEPDGKHFISAGWDHMIVRWRRSEGSNAGATNTNRHAIYRARFLKSGRLVTSGYDGSIRTWDIENSREVGKLADVVQPITAMAVAGSEKFVLAGSWDKKLRLWSLEESGAAQEFPSRELSTDAGMIWDIALSPDDKQAAAARFDGPIVLWNVEKGEPIAELGKHEGGALAVTYLDDGKKLLTAGRDGAIKLWDVAEKKLVREQDFGDLWIESLAASPDGKYALVGLSARDKVEADKTNPAAGTCLLFNLQTWNVDARLSTGLPCVYAAAFSPDGRDIVTGSGGEGNVGGGSVCFWRLEHVLRYLGSPPAAEAGPPLKATQLQRMRGHNEYVLTVAYAQGEKILASAGADRAIILWNPETAESRQTAKLHTDHVRQIAFSPDNTRFLTAGNDRVLRLWNTDTLAVEKTLTGHKEHVSSVVFLPDGKRAISGSDDKSVILWSLDKPEPLFTATMHKGVVSCLALSPDGKTLASAGGDNHVVLSEVQDNNLVPKHTLTGHIGEIRGLAFTPDGQYVISGSRDSTVRFWNTADGKFVKSISPEIGLVYSVAVSPDGKWLAVGGGNWQKGTVKIYDILTSRQPAVIPAFQGFVHSLAFTPDSQKLAAGSADKTVTIWKLDAIAANPDASTASAAPPQVKLAPAATGAEPPFKHVAALPGHGSPIFALAVASDGLSALSASDDQFVRLWDLPGRKQTREFKASGAMRCVAISPDGTRLAWSGGQKEIVIWDLKEDREFRRLAGHRNWVYSLQFTKDNHKLLSIGRDKMVALWDLSTNEPSFIVETIDRQDIVAALSPDETKILAHSDNEVTLSLWNIADKQRLARLSGHGPEGIFAAAFSPDGKQIATADGRGFIHLRDATTGDVRVAMRGHIGRITSLAFTPDSKHLVSGGFDHALCLRDAQTGALVARTVCDKPVTNQIAMHPSGRQVLTAGGWFMNERDEFEQPGDFDVHVWELPTLSVPGSSLGGNESEAPPREPRTIPDLMKAGFERPGMAAHNAFLGKATADDLKSLRQFAVDLAQQKPPQGTVEAWKSRTDELLAATDATIAGQENAVNRLRKAISCVDCHRDHRPAAKDQGGQE